MLRRSTGEEARSRRAQLWITGYAFTLSLACAVTGILGAMKANGGLAVIFLSLALLFLLCGLVTQPKKRPSTGQRRPGERRA